MRLPIQIECILFKKDSNSWKFLLLKRIESRGGFWQPITGGLEEEDKSNLDCAFREIWEETGVKKDNVLRVIENIHKFEFGDPPLKEYVFGMEINPIAEVDLSNNVYEEHSETGWFSFKEGIELLKWENNKDALKKLYVAINHQ